MKTKVIPIIDQIYMGRRYYNAKRIVFEPFVFKGTTPNQNFPGREIVLGTWIMSYDQTMGGIRGADINNMKPLDHKWVERKVSDLEREGYALLAQATNLLIKTNSK